MSAKEAAPAFIAQMRELAARSGTLQSLPAHPDNPDALLLGLCSVAVEQHKHVTQAKNDYCERKDFSWSADSLAQDKKLRENWNSATGELTTLLRRAAKLHAVTPAGIYAKALMVSKSRTGAAVLAKSLAEDLIANTTLRAALWPVAVP
jgi:hypothetical protein